MPTQQEELELRFYRLFLKTLGNPAYNFEGELRPILAGMRHAEIAMGKSKGRAQEMERQINSIAHVSEAKQRAMRSEIQMKLNDLSNSFQNKKSPTAGTNHKAMTDFIKS